MIMNTEPSAAAAAVEAPTPSSSTLTNNNNNNKHHDHHSLPEATRRIWNRIAASDTTTQGSHNGYCRVASQSSDRVFNEECVYTFYTPFFSSSQRGGGGGGGIVVNLQTWIGTIPELAFCGVFTTNDKNNNNNHHHHHHDKNDQDASSSSSSLVEGLFVRIVKEKVLKKEQAAAAQDDDNDNDNDNDSIRNNNPEPPMPTKLGIGVEGGFATEEDKYDIQATYSIVHLQQQPQGEVVVISELSFDPEHHHLSHSNNTTTTTTTTTSSSSSSSFELLEWPRLLIQSVESVIYHSGSTLQQEVQAWQIDHQGQDTLPISKYAHDLPYCDNGVVFPPSSPLETWSCQQHPHHPQAKDWSNLWLNLSDGFLGGGRCHWDGSGGTNGALDHYNETGQLYPLVVKVGTLSANGITNSTADCYSYAPDEDGPVQIPNLPQLLQRRPGLWEWCQARTQKTVLTTAELEVQYNYLQATYNLFSNAVITEEGSKQALVPRSGPWLQGLQNLGNSCYLNSVAQLLFHLPELAQRYAHSNHQDSNTTTRVVVGPRWTIFHAVPPPQAPDHVLVQTAKLATALVTGIYSQTKTTTTTNKEEDVRVLLAPRMFKQVIGKNHVDFSTGQQQDAAQFLQYFLEQLDRAEQAHKTHFMSTATLASSTTSSSSVPTLFYPSSHWLSFATETRSVCTADQKVKYDSQTQTTQRRETIWSVPIPMELATTPSPLPSLSSSSESPEGGATSATTPSATTTTTTTTSTTTTTAKEGPDPKRHKCTTEEKEDPAITTSAAAAETAETTTSTTTTTTPMEMETPLAIMGITTTTTTANEAASSSAMDTGSHSTAATAATATTATTATMALTDDEEEGPSNNNNNSSNNNNNKSDGSSTQDGSTSEALSKRGTSASSNSTTTTNNQNKNPNPQKTGAAATTATASSQPPPAVPLPQISLVTCLDQWAAEHVVDDVRWPHLGPQAPRHAALRTTKLVNFPPYLILQLQRYRWGDDGQPQKLQVELLLDSTTQEDDHDDDKKSKTTDKNDPNDNSDNDKKNKKNKNIYIIDLAKYKAPGGPQPGEDLVPNDDDIDNDHEGATMSNASAAASFFPNASAAAGTVAAAAAAAVLDENALAQLMDMGFSLNSSKRALTAVGGSSVEAAMGWVFEHNNDPDFNDPLPTTNTTTDDDDDHHHHHPMSTPAAAAAAASSSTSHTTSAAADRDDYQEDAVVQNLVEMLGCFTAEQVRFGLKQTHGDADRAADWLFSRMDDLDSIMMMAEAKAAESKPSASASSLDHHHPTTTTTSLPPLEDSTTCSTYQLTGLISHIGKHTGSGHYVAHVLVPGQQPSSPPQWIIFNDEKVAESEHPPVKHAYLYLFQRTDTLGASLSSSWLLRTADGGHSTTKDDDDDDDAPDHNHHDNSHHDQEADNNDDDDDDRMES